MADGYVWMIWSASFLLPWTALYLAFPRQRRAMMWASLFTMPFGLTEPLFVPAYWSPPSLFDLARRTGFDIESLVFSFAIGGIAAVLFGAFTRRSDRPMEPAEWSSPRHRFHLLALLTPVLVFPLLYVLPWNPIYPAIVAMGVGALANTLCRPELGQNAAVGALLFVGYYALWLIGLELTAPGYIEAVWNLDALSGLMIAGMPVEELMFALAFGAYWSGIYEHANLRTAMSA